MAVYLCPEPLAEASGYHASGVGLDGQHGTKTPPESLSDQEASAAGLDESHAEASDPVASVVLPGPADRLEAQEARLHLEERDAVLSLIYLLSLVNMDCCFFDLTFQVALQKHLI